MKTVSTMIAFRGCVLTEIAPEGQILQIMMIRVRNGRMTEKQRRELQKARMNEFLSDDDEIMRKGMRDIGRMIASAQEEAGLNRLEAIYFVATMLGQSMRQG